MQYHFSIMHDPVASRHVDIQRAAEAHRLASAVPGPGIPPPAPDVRGDGSGTGSLLSGL